MTQVNGPSEKKKNKCSCLSLLGNRSLLLVTVGGFLRILIYGKIGLADSDAGMLSVFSKIEDLFLLLAIFY